jgi:tetratricopeptide (TPR) repeat protein
VARPKKTLAETHHQPDARTRAVHGSSRRKEAHSEGSWNLLTSAAARLIKKALPGLAIIVLVFVAYGPALRAGFVWDDDKYVTDNPMLTAPDGLRQIWFSAHTQSQYFPLVYTTFKVERMLWGLNPLGYHLVNVLLHGLNAVLAWGLLRRLRLPGAWLAAAIFALHPVQVESVAWVTELKNLESLFFYLLALLAWLKVVEAGGASSADLQSAVTPISNRQAPAGHSVSKTGGSRSPQGASKTQFCNAAGGKSALQHRPSDAPGGGYWYLLALGAYLLALFAKTTACTLPAALVLLVWLRGQRLSWRRTAQIVPFVLLGLVMGLVSIWWEGNLGSYNRGLGLSFTFLERALIASRGLWFYAGKLLWPVNLAFSYPRWEISAAKPLQYIPLAGCVVVAVALWVWRRRLGLGVIAGVLFFVASLAPLLGFISNYTFQYSFVADHYQYVASIGLIAVAAGALFTLSASEGWAPFWPRCAGGVLLAVLGWLTAQQCGAYLNSETLWRDTLAKNPSSWMAHHNLAMDLQEQGALDEAAEHYRAAIVLNPRHTMALNNLGLIEAGKRDLAAAVEHYEAALAVEPGFALAHNNLALALARRGDYEGAVKHLRRALEIEPRMLGAMMNLGDVLKAQGQQQAALETYRKAAALFPTESAPWRSLAALLLEKGRGDEAVAAYRQGLKAAPDRPDLLLGLSGVLAAQTNYTEAAACCQRVLAADPGNAAAHCSLGELLARQDRVVEARKELQEALRLQPDSAEAMQQLLLLTLRPAK